MISHIFIEVMTILTCDGSELRFLTQYLKHEFYNKLGNCIDVYLSRVI